ncbi:MAG: chemotaxis-specific protein-glutamate methyltransferase CheB [Solirubrobacteraceae bacterium]|jgi:two-component system chemotaxis response regulator CheB
MTATAATRVVIADDSALMRSVLGSALDRAGIDVVAFASDGNEALDCCERLAPDVLSLDLAMPGRDGVSVLRELRARGQDIPVIVVSAFSKAAGVCAVDALAEGAFDVVPKPASREEVDSFIAMLGERVALAAAESQRRRAPASAAGARYVAAAPTGEHRVVVIACSTGGPRALAALLPRLPATLGDGTLIIQHMPPGFTAPLAARLDRASTLTVAEAGGHDRISSSRALLAPGGRHLRVLSRGHVTLSDEPAIGGLRPRADITIRDAAAVWGERLLLVVLTGMGKDGLDGAVEVHKAGGRILVEAESSCVVYGMPRVIVEAGLADAELDLDGLPEAILAEAGP